MTFTIPRGGDAAAERMVAIAMEQVEALAERLDELVRRIEAGEMPDAAEVKKTVAEYRATIRTAMTERQRLEDDFRKGGFGKERELDFGRARDEIGCRLARLRAARDGGAVPDGAG